MNFILALVLFSAFDCPCGTSYFKPCVEDKKELCELRAYSEKVSCILSLVKEEQEVPAGMSSGEFKKQLDIKTDKCVSVYTESKSRCNAEYMETISRCKNRKKEKK